MSGVIRWVAPLVSCLAVVWLALILAAPWLPAAPAAIVYAFASLVCHQIGERSFYAGAVQLPVCARCVGIYAGFAVAVAWAAPPRRWTPRWTLIAGAAPTAITVVAEWAGLWQPSNMARSLAGAALGLAVALVVKAALATLHYGECAPRPPIAPDRPPSHI